MPRTRTAANMTSDRDGAARQRRPRHAAAASERHDHRTAKVVELIGSSRRGFEDAVKTALKDAAETTRGITGAHVTAWSVKCEDGRVVEYKAAIKVAFGIERT